MTVRPGYKQTELGMIPFDWDLFSLEDIAKVTSGKRLPLGKKLTEFETPHPYIRVSDMRVGTVSLKDIRFVPTHVFPAIRNYRVFEGEIFISVAGTLGIVGVVPPALDGANLTENANRIASINCVAGYLLHVLGSPIVQSIIHSIRTVGAQPKLALTRIRKFQIPLPASENEQQAIAEALSDADALIESLEQLIAKKRQIKQGAMQQLLTGRKRLPGFSDDWDTQALGDVVDFLSGGTPPRSIERYWTGSIPWISASSLRCSSISRSDNNVTEDAVRAGSKMAPLYSTLLLVRGSALHNEILCGLVTASVCFNQDIKALVPKAQLIPGFLTLFINGISDDLMGLVSSAGNTAGVLDTKLLKAIKIPIPSPSEQAAIAEILSDMETEITELETRLAKARQVKQGMMQQLLTGRIRLVKPQAQPIAQANAAAI